MREDFFSKSCVLRSLSQRGACPFTSNQVKETLIAPHGNLVCVSSSWGDIVNWHLIFNSTALELSPRVSWDKLCECVS